MNEYGIEVAEKDVEIEEAEEYQLTLKSGQTLLKEFAKGIVVMSSDPTTITHDLGYAPQFLVWAIYPDYPDYEGLNTVLLMTGNFDAGAAYMTTSALNLQPSSGQGNNSDAKYYIFYDPLDGTEPSAIFVNGDYGLEVSKDGVDVQDANIFEQTFNSEKNTLKFTEGEFTSTGSSDIDITVAHGLDVIPGYLVYFKVGSGAWYSVWEKETVSGANVQVGAISEDSNIYIQIRRTSSCAVTVKIYAFVDPAN